MTHVATVTIDSTQVSSDLTDYPVFIDLSGMPSSFWSTVTASGGDIRCYKSDGTTELPREVVACDTSLETGELHVLYSGTLSSSSDTEIQIHADGSSSDYAATDTYGSEAVWVDYRAVYHCQESSGVLVDSSANGADLTVASGFTYAADGKLSKSIANTSASGTDRTEGTTDTSGFSSLTLQTWIYSFADATTGPAAVMGFGGGLNGMVMYYRTNPNTFHLDTTESSEISTTSTLASGTNTWASLYSTFDTTNGQKIYFNGSQQDSSSVTTAVGSSNGAVVLLTQQETDSSASTLNNMDGFRADEARIRDGELSSDWIATEYINQHTPATFYSVESATAGTSVNVTLGTVVLSELAATAQADVDTNITATLDAVTVTAFDATLTVGENTDISVTTDAAVLAVFDASVQANINTDVTATLENISLSGLQSTISVGGNVNIVTTADAVSVNTFNATVQADVDANISVTTDAVSVSPLDVTVRQPVEISASSEAITVQKFDVAVLLDGQTEIFVTTETINLTGNAAVVNLSVGIPITSSSVALTVFDSVVLTEVSGQTGFYRVTNDDPDAVTPGTGFYDDVMDDPDANTSGSGFFR